MTNELEELNSLIDIYKIDDESTLEDLLKITGNITNNKDKLIINYKSKKGRLVILRRIILFYCKNIKSNKIMFNRF
jgi:hypothetical protein